MDSPEAQLGAETCNYIHSATVSLVLSSGGAFRSQRLQLQRRGGGRGRMTSGSQ